MSQAGSTGAQEDPLWDRGWDEHRDRQLRRWARLPFSQKLEWLEEAHELACNLQASRERAGKSSPPVPKDT